MEYQLHCYRSFRKEAPKDIPEGAHMELEMPLGRARDMVRVWARHSPSFSVALDIVMEADGLTLEEVFAKYCPSRRAAAMNRDDTGAV